MSGMEWHKVFISYRHESDSHCRRVRDLAAQLEACGLTVILDELADEREFNHGGPPHGWTDWSYRMAEVTASVIAVASAGWFQAFNADGPVQSGKGAAAEAKTIQQRLYDKGGYNDFFRIVYFTPEDLAHLPDRLKGNKRFNLEVTQQLAELQQWLQRPTTSASNPTRAEFPEVATSVSKPIVLPYVSLGAMFLGREDALQSLRNRLMAGSGRAAVVTPERQQAIHGLGGVGKTRLAVEYAWRHATDYKALLFVVGDTPANLNSNLAALAKPLHLPEQHVTEQRIQVEAVLTWLATFTGWLLIFDNIDTDAMAKAVEDLLPRLVKGHVLVTSRLSSWSGSVLPLELDVLDPTAAVQFLQERTNSGDQSTAAASELAQELGGLALALEQAAAYVLKKRITLANYLQRWRAHTRTVQEWYDERLMHYPRSIAITWQTTLDQLPAEHVALLNALAWLAPEPIPLSLFEGEAADGIWRDATSNAGSESLLDALATLAEFSLVKWPRDSETVTVHRVVQEILRTRQGSPDNALTLTLRLLNMARPDGDPADVRTWPRWELLRPHVAFATNEADRCKIAEPTSLLMGALGTVLWGKALHTDAEKLERRALEIDTSHFGPDSTQVATRLNNLAQTLKDTNRLAEAETCMRRALAIDEKRFGPDSPYIAIGLSNLAILLKTINRLAEAEPLMRRALAIDEQAYGPTHPAVAIDLNNLAALLQATDQLGEAEPLIRRALEIDQKEYGPEHPNVATHLNNLGQLLKDTKRFTEAESHMRRALAIDEQAYGAEHPIVAVRLNNLALLLQSTNRLDEAEPLIRRALAIDEKAYQSDHPDVATDLNNLGQLLQAINRLDEAEPLMRRALAIDEKSFGLQHPDVARDLNNLAQLLRTANRLHEAAPLLQRAHSIFDASLGFDHPKTITTRENLELLMRHLGSTASHPYLRKLLLQQRQKRAVEMEDYQKAIYCRDQVAKLNLAHPDFVVEFGDNVIKLLDRLVKLRTVSIPTKRAVGGRLLTASDPDSLLDVKRGIDFVADFLEDFEDFKFRKLIDRLEHHSKLDRLSQAIGITDLVTKSGGGVGPDAWLNYLQHDRTNAELVLYCIANRYVWDQPTREEAFQVAKVFDGLGHSAAAADLRDRYAAD